MLPHNFYEMYLVREWRSINDKLFGGALLVPPTFFVTTMEHHAADWNASKRLIRFSQSFITSHHWATVVEVLKHEMAHQYVSDVLGIGGEETAHGPAFRMVCERYAIDARASGVKRTEREEHAIDRIKKLFSLGTSANENEAKAALKKAHQLLDEYGLTEGDLRSDPDAFGVAHLGEVVLRSTPENYRLVVSNVLTRHFRVETIWVHTLDKRGEPGLQLEICGRRCDLAIGEHVHDFLHAEALRLWRRTKRSGRREMVDFLEGVMRGFLETLDAEEKAKSGAAAASAPGLVHVAMKAGLRDYLERRNPSLRTLRGSRRQRGAMFGEGMSAGRRITINEPLPGAGPRLLARGRESKTQSSEED